MNSEAIIADVLDYWFGPTASPDPDYRKRWFQGGDATDQDIQQRFGNVHQTLQNGLPHDWPTTADGLLAAIIVIDQFSRNLFRKQPQAFAWDNLAQQWSLQGWQNSLFKNLEISRQAFSLMPLMHSENLSHHDFAISQFEQLKDQAAPADTIITGFYSSALEHRAIIAEFGRYPHRNDVLNRPTTDKERDYLAGDAKRFGQ